MIKNLHCYKQVRRWPPAGEEIAEEELLFLVLPLVTNYLNGSTKIFTHHRIGPFFNDRLLSNEGSETMDNTFWDPDLTVLRRVDACV